MKKRMWTTIIFVVLLIMYKPSDARCLMGFETSYEDARNFCDGYVEYGDVEYGNVELCRNGLYGCFVWDVP